MTPLLFTAALPAEFARLALAAGGSVLVLLAVAAWALHALDSREDGSDD